jgi:hypothetical protein
MRAYRGPVAEAREGSPGGDVTSAVTSASSDHIFGIILYPFHVKLKNIV